MDTAHGIKQSVSGKANNNLLNQIIGKTVTYGKLGLGGMMLLLALHLWLAPAYGSGTLTENFADNQYNTRLWGVFQEMGDGATPQVTNNRLEISVAGDGYAGLHARGFTLIGDFDMKVDFTLIDWPTSNGTQLGIGPFTIPESVWVTVARANSPLRPSQEIYFSIFEGVYADTTITGPPLSGTLRLKRTGNQMEGLYWDGADWQTLATATNPDLGGRVGVNMHCGPYGGTYSGIAAKAAFSNIRIDYTTLGVGFGNPGPGIMMMMYD